MLCLQHRDSSPACRRILFFSPDTIESPCEPSTHTPRALRPSHAIPLLPLPPQSKKKKKAAFVDSYRRYRYSSLTCRLCRYRTPPPQETRKQNRIFSPSATCGARTERVDACGAPWTSRQGHAFTSRSQASAVFFTCVFLSLNCPPHLHFFLRTDTWWETKKKNV